MKTNRSSIRLRPSCTSKIPFFAAALLFAAFCFSTSASAQILFDNGPAVGDSGYYADSGGYFGQNTELVSAAGNIFTPTLSGTVHYIQFTGYYYSGGPSNDVFTVQLYSTSAGAPDTLLYSNTFSNFSEVQSAFGDYTVTEDLSVPFALSTGTTYFFAIGDHTSPFTGFALPESAGTATVEYSEVGGAFLTPEDDSPLSFVLSASFIPEPSTWAMLLVGMGLLGLAGSRRESKQFGQ